MRQNDSPIRKADASVVSTRCHQPSSPALESSVSLPFSDFLLGPRTPYLCILVSALFMVILFAADPVEQQQYSFRFHSLCVKLFRVRTFLPGFVDSCCKLNLLILETNTKVGGGK